MFSKNQNDSRFKRLIRLEDNKLVIDQQGLDIIQSYYDQNIVLIALEGQPTKIIRTFLSDKQSIPQTNKSQIWISSHPMVDQLSGKKIHFIQTYCSVEQNKPKLHLFNSIAANLIILNMNQNTPLSYLNSLVGRICIDQNKKIQKSSIASLALLFREAKATFQEDKQLFNRILSKYEILNQVKTTYDCFGAIKFPTDKEITTQMRYLLQQIIYKTSSSLNSKNNNQFKYGPVFKSYLENVVYQINHLGMVNLHKAEQDIQVTGGYHAFTSAIYKYHQLAKSSFKNKPTSSFTQICLKNRKEAERIYKQSSNDTLYYDRLRLYIDKKEEALKEINNKLYDEQNVKFLKNQSQVLLKKIKSQKENNPNLIKDEFGSLVKRYEKEAGGDNKQKLMNEYLNQIIPVLYQKNQNKEQLISQLEQVKQQNNLLQKQLNAKQNKACCEIM